MKNKEVEEHLTDTAKQSSIVFFGKILGYIFGFIINFVLAKFFGPEVVGQYTLISTIVNMVAIFSVFGLDNGLVKYISRYRSINDRNKLQIILRIAFIYGLALSIITSVIVFILRNVIANDFFNDSKLIEPIFYGAWIIITLTLIRLLNGVYRGFKKLTPYIIAKNIIQKVVFIFIILLLVVFNFKNIHLVVIALLFSQIIVVIYLIFNIKSLSVDLTGVFNNINSSFLKFTPLKKEFLTYSSTLIFISFMGVILSKIDRIMIGIYMSSKLVGIYSIAAKIVSLAGFVLISSNQIFTPVISELYFTDKLDVLEDLYSIITKWIIIITLPIIVSMIIFSRTIMNFFGDEYIKGATVLIILAVGQIIRTFPGANGALLNMSGNEKLVLMNNFIMAILNIILNVILIPIYGMKGAAFATAISIIIINICKVIQSKMILDITPYRREYLYLVVNLIIVILVGVLFKLFYNNVLGVFIVTTINILLSVGSSYLFSNELDKVIFNKVIIRINKKFKELK